MSKLVYEASTLGHGEDPWLGPDILEYLRPSTGAPLPDKDRRREREADRRRREELAELPGDELARLIHTLEEEMAEASTDLRFEYAARLRDEIKDLLAGKPPRGDGGEPSTPRSSAVPTTGAPDAGDAVPQPT